jgi:hypothetical protein
LNRRFIIILEDILSFIVTFFHRPALALVRGQKSKQLALKRSNSGEKK